MRRLRQALSTLSPCVLPLIPMVLGAAVGKHRHGPVVLAGGLAVSFVTIGMFIATIGYALGLDAGSFRIIGAVLLMAIGLALLVPTLQTQFAVVAVPNRQSFQVPLVMTAFGVGAALPLLFLHYSFDMWMARTYPSIPFERYADLLGLLSREAMVAWRGRLLNAGKTGKMALGGLLLALGLMIASGLAKRIETFLVDLSPAWLTELTTRF
jgi:cytochrome c biogenesis protein CcdA